MSKDQVPYSFGWYERQQKEEVIRLVTTEVVDKFSQFDDKGKKSLSLALTKVIRDVQRPLTDWQLLLDPQIFEMVFGFQLESLNKKIHPDEFEIIEAVRQLNFDVLRQLLDSAEVLDWIQAGTSRAYKEFKLAVSVNKKMFVEHPVIEWRDIQLFLTHPNAAYLRTKCSFSRFLLISSSFWRPAKLNFDTGFLLNFPDFTALLGEYLETLDDSSAEVSNWSEALDVFDQIMLLIGRYGVTDAQLSDQLEKHYLVAQAGSKVKMTQDLRRRLRSGLSFRDELLLRQQILAEQDVHPDWRMSKADMEQLRFLESKYNPNYHLHVSHGYEIEYIAHHSNLTDSNVYNGVHKSKEVRENRPFFELPIYGLLHQMGIMNLGADVGEVAPGPWMLEKHSDLFFRRFLDAGLLDVYQHFSFSCHFNLGLRNDEFFGALCQMLRATGYAFSPIFDLKAEIDPSHKFSLTNRKNYQSDRGPSYWESKQFRFLSPENHRLFMNAGVKLGQAAKAAEKVAFLPHEKYSESMISLAFGQMNNITLNDVYSSNHLTVDERRLAEVWLKAFRHFQEALDVIDAPSGWKATLPAVEEIAFESRLAQVFPTLFSQLNLERPNNFFSARRREGIPFDSPIKVRDKYYFNFVYFCRKLVNDAAEEVDKIMDVAYLDLSLMVEQICKGYQAGATSQEQTESGRVIQQYWRRFCFKGTMPGNWHDHCSTHFERARIYKQDFLDLQQQLKACGL